MLLLAGAAFLASCQEERRPAPEASAEVSVVRLSPESVSLSDRLPGRIVMRMEEADQRRRESAISRSQSPIRLIDSVVNTMTAPGTAAIHQASAM